MENNPFYILNISENSTIEDVKKQFHLLLFKIHPDISKNYSKENNDFLKKIIDSYNLSIKILKNKEKIKKTKIEDIFFNLFGIKFFNIDSEVKILQLIIILLKKLNTIYYSDTLIITKFREIVIYINNQIEKQKIFSNNQLEILFFKSFYLLINSLIKSKKKNNYFINKSRNIFEKYIFEIINSKDYLSYRQNIFYSIDNILLEMIYCFNKCKNDLDFKEEISLYIFLIGIFNEDIFYEKIYNIISKGENV